VAPEDVQIGNSVAAILGSIVGFSLSKQSDGIKFGGASVPLNAPVEFNNNNSGRKT
jgi:hypothetical protein